MKRVLFFAGCVLSATPLAAENVTTYHYDNLRTGWNSHETVLTPSSVASAAFGVVARTPLDGQVDAQPLVVNGTAYIVTENNTVYAIDGATGVVIRSVNLGPPVPTTDPLARCGSNTLPIGIRSTPVVDLSLGVMFGVSYTYENGAQVYRLHQLTIPGLAEISSVKIAATHILSDGSSFTFNARYQRQNSALLESNGNVYVAFSSFCDIDANLSRGWLMGWTASTLAALPNTMMPDMQTAAQTKASNGACSKPFRPCYEFYLSSIWMSGYGVAADPHGNLFFATGNSDGVRPNNLQESIVRLTPDLGRVVDYFTPYNFQQYDIGDADVGSGGVMLAPGLPERAFAGGKPGDLYVIDRAKMGKYVPGGPDRTPSLPMGGSCWCGPSYFIGSDGVGRIVTSGGNLLRTWRNTDPFPSSWEAQAALPASVQDGGFFTSVSSNGTRAGTAIIWAVGRPTSTTTPNVTLYAFAGTATGGALPQIYSAIAGDWPNLGRNANIVPVVADGRVYIASNKMLTIFGLRP